METKIKEKAAELLLSSGAIILRPAEPFRFASGILSPIYCDNRILLSKPRERELVSDWFAKLIAENSLNADVIAGVATASIAWAALVSDRLGKPMIYVRKEAKDHGRENLIEGELKKDQNVLVIEDLVSTGSSLLTAVNAIRNAGAKADNCISIFNYEMDAAEKAFQNSKCRLFSLTGLSTITKVASDKGFIKEKDLKLLEEWKKSPETWGI